MFPNNMCSDYESRKAMIMHLTRRPVNPEIIDCLHFSVQVNLADELLKIKQILLQSGQK